MNSFPRPHGDEASWRWDPREAAQGELQGELRFAIISVRDKPTVALGTANNPTH